MTWNFMLRKKVFVKPDLKLKFMEVENREIQFL